MEPGCGVRFHGEGEAPLQCDLGVVSADEEIGCVGVPVSRFTFHHLGCAVKSIHAALAAYWPLGARASESVLVAAQRVRVCFVELTAGLRIELIEPAEEGSAVDELLRRGISFYHTAYSAPDFDAAIQHLESSGYHALKPFRSEAFGNKRCVFLMGPARQLVELIETQSVCR